MTEFLHHYCLWGATVCKPFNHTDKSKYSDRRLNRNSDVVLAQLLDEYNGPMRTRNASEADLFVVPYPMGTQEMTMLTMRRKVQTQKLQQDFDQLVSELEFWNETTTTKHKHLFLFSGHDSVAVRAPLRAMIAHVKKPGDIVVPYVNTLPEYQPQQSLSAMSETDLDLFFDSKKYSIAAVLSKRISGNGALRAALLENHTTWFNGTDVVAGLPFRITDIAHKRKLPNESAVMQLYRESLF